MPDLKLPAELEDLKRRRDESLIPQVRAQLSVDYAEALEVHLEKAATVQKAVLITPDEKKALRLLNRESGGDPSGDFGPGSRWEYVRGLLENKGLVIVGGDGKAVLTEKGRQAAAQTAGYGEERLKAATVQKAAALSDPRLKGYPKPMPKGHGRLAECPECDGKGLTHAGEKVCAECSGHGKIDLDRKPKFGKGAVTVDTAHNSEPDKQGYEDVTFYVDGLPEGSRESEAVDAASKEANLKYTDISWRQASRQGRKWVVRANARKKMGKAAAVSDPRLKGYPKPMPKGHGRLAECPECDGKGLTHAGEKVCAECAGHGKIDLDRYPKFGKAAPAQMRKGQPRRNGQIARAMAEKTLAKVAGFAWGKPLPTDHRFSLNGDAADYTCHIRPSGNAENSLTVRIHRKHTPSDSQRTGTLDAIRTFSRDTNPAGVLLAQAKGWADAWLAKQKPPKSDKQAFIDSVEADGSQGDHAKFKAAPARMRKAAGFTWKAEAGKLPVGRGGGYTAKLILVPGSENTSHEYYDVSITGNGERARSQMERDIEGAKGWADSWLAGKAKKAAGGEMRKGWSAVAQEGIARGTSYVQYRRQPPFFLSVSKDGNTLSADITEDDERGNEYVRAEKGGFTDVQEAMAWADEAVKKLTPRYSKAA